MRRALLGFALIIFTLLGLQVSPSTLAATGTATKTPTLDCRTARVATRTPSPTRPRGCPSPTARPPTRTRIPTRTGSPTRTRTRVPAIQPTTSRSGGGSGLGNFDSNGDGRVTCADFQTQAQAQEAFNAGYTRLDGNDNDGRACESLP